MEGKLRHHEAHASVVYMCSSWVPPRPQPNIVFFRAPYRFWSMSSLHRRPASTAVCHSIEPWSVSTRIRMHTRRFLLSPSSHLTREQNYFASGYSLIWHTDFGWLCYFFCPEQVLYYDSGRFLVIPCALVSFITLSTGTWLFTIVHPAFYWFGLPSAFLMFYLGCHCEFFISSSPQPLYVGFLWFTLWSLKKHRIRSTYSYTKKHRIRSI